MKLGAKELRKRVGDVLKDVQKGKEIIITYRGTPTAVIKPFKKGKKAFNPIGFGMWAKRKDLKDVEKWLEEKRKTRYGS